MTAIYVQKTLNGAHNIKLQSGDPSAFKACIERLKLGIASTKRVYNPATKTWRVDAYATSAMQAWLKHCMQHWAAQIQWLDADADAGEQPEEEDQAWTPPSRQLTRAAALKTLYLLPDAPACVVKAAFKVLSLEAHPDKPGGNTRKQQQLNAAYELLVKQVAA